jgi:hypothetical protein
MTGEPSHEQCKDDPKTAQQQNFCSGNNPRAVGGIPLLFPQKKCTSMTAIGVWAAQATVGATQHGGAQPAAWAHRAKIPARRGSGRRPHRQGGRQQGTVAKSAASGSHKQQQDNARPDPGE